MQYFFIGRRINFQQVRKPVKCLSVGGCRGVVGVQRPGPVGGSRPDRRLSEPAATDKLVVSGFSGGDQRAQEHGQASLDRGTRCLTVARSWDETNRDTTSESRPHRQAPGFDVYKCGAAGAGPGWMTGLDVGNLDVEEHRNLCGQFLVHREFLSFRVGDGSVSMHLSIRICNAGGCAGIRRKRQQRKCDVVGRQRQNGFVW